MDRTLAFRALCGLTSLAGSLAVVALGHWFLGTEKTTEAYSNNPIFLFMTVLLSIEGTARVVGWILYRPAASIENDDALPSITAVIPAYNEGKFIRYALSSILRSDYPKDKIRVIAVDDGSSDDTWEHMLAMQPAFDAANVCFVPHRHHVNMGKRAGIQTGFGLATGDVIVSLDSDSVLETRALRNLVAPLVRDPTIGGVAGYLSALNTGAGKNQMVPRLLDVLYDMSGNIPRSAQSQAGHSVTILPGALSAYRAKAVRPLLAKLNTSSFRGQPLRHGEDIELTLGLLQSGWGTTYQSNAVVHTTAPDTARRAFLMYTRWERSSYVYLLMGFFRLALASAARKICNWCVSKLAAVQDTAGGEKKGVAKAPKLTELVGDVYVLLNLVCTAINNLLVPVACITQARNVYLHPEMVPTFCLVVALSSAFRNFLFLADAWVEGLDEETTELHMPTCSCGEESEADSDSGYGSASEASCRHGGKATGPLDDKITVPSRRDRLAWRFQYGSMASVFHMGYISWTSIAALCSLESQSWLTR